MNWTFQKCAMASTPGLREWDGAAVSEESHNQ